MNVEIKRKILVCIGMVMTFCGILNAGVYTFTDADVSNSNWSDSDNWSGGVLPLFDDSCVVTQASIYAVIDTNATIQSLIISDELTSEVVFAGTNTLYFVQQDNSSYFIKHYGAGSLRLTGNYDFYNNVNVYRSCTIGNMVSGASITFCTNSITSFRTKTKILNGSTYFLGSISSVFPELYFYSDVVFGAASSLESVGKLTFTYTTIDINTTNFNAGTKMTTITPTTININADDAFQSKSDLDTDATTILNVNGNTQLGEIVLDSPNTRAITVNLASDVEYFTFDDCSAIGWGDETLVINGFRPGVIRFGENNGGLTPTQLTQIVADGEGTDGVTLDSNGWLIGISKDGPIINIR